MLKLNKHLIKRFICLSITIILLLCTGCSNQDNKADNSTKTNSSESRTESTFSNSEVQNKSFLSVPYNVEDYVENSIIVSKTNGLLYGVLDNKGNEIIPVKYDKIEFLNKNDYLKGLTQKLYIKAEYENTSYIFDQQGNEIFKTDDNTISYANSFIVNDGAPFFVEHVREHTSTVTYYTGEEIWYTEDMTEIARIKDDDGDQRTVIKPFSSKGYYNQIFDSAAYTSTNYQYPLAQKVTNYRIYIYDFNGNVINKFENYEYCFVIHKTGNELIICLAESDPNDITAFHLNANGETYKTEKITYEEYKNNYYKPSPYKLYSSNGTYKLETNDGKTMYDERYYKSFDFAGENDCKGLMNENNEIMLFNRNGEKILDYGYLSSADNEGKTIKLQIDGQEKTVKNIHEGKNSIIIPFKSSAQEGTDIYFFAK